MAVTPMKLVTIVGPIADFDDVILRCVINQEFHPEPASAVSRHVKHLNAFELENPYADILRQTEIVADRMSISLDFKDTQLVQEDVDELLSYVRSLEKKHTAFLDQRQELQKLIDESDVIVSHLQHLAGLNVELSEFFGMKYVKLRFGHMPRDTYQSILPLVDDREDVFFFPASIGKNVVYGVYMTTRAAYEKVDSFFASLHFTRVRIARRVQGNSVEAIEQVKREAEDAKKRLAAVEEALASFLQAEKDKVLATYTYARLQNDSYNIRRFAAHTLESFYILGWVPEHRVEAFMELVSQAGPKCVAVQDTPEQVEEYKPPVKLKNNWLFKPFEPFLGMYGLPAYNEMDPTPFMAISYTILFGIMFGDIGQGAVLAILGFLSWKFMHIWLGRIIAYAGLSSVCFGFVYGSVFGNEHILPGFKVLEGANSQSLFQWTINGGVVMICLVMLFNVINGIRQKNFERMLFSPSALAGLVFYLAFMGLALPFIGFGEQLVSAPILVGILVLPFILIFLREPLSKLCAKRKDWQPHSWGDFIVENLFEMVEVLISYVTNTLSFIRIGAYAVSHASMMGVVYMLAQQSDGSHNIVGLIFGNIVIIALEGLLAGIQVLRLEFYELFSRFYVGNGRPFAPVIINYKKRD